MLLIPLLEKSQLKKNVLPQSSATTEWYLQREHQPREAQNLIKLWG